MEDFKENTIILVIAHGTQNNKTSKKKRTCSMPRFLFPAVFCASSLRSAESCLQGEFFFFKMTT
jgi:hypothetical protein